MSAADLEQETVEHLSSLAEEIDRPDDAEMLEAVREIAQGPLAAIVDDIDRGLYPKEIMQQLGEAGAFRASWPACRAVPAMPVPSRPLPRSRRSAAPPAS